MRRARNRPRPRGGRGAGVPPGRGCRRGPVPGGQRHGRTRTGRTPPERGRQNRPQPSGAGAEPAPEVADALRGEWKERQRPGRLRVRSTGSPRGPARMGSVRRPRRCAVVRRETGGGRSRRAAQDPGEGARAVRRLSRRIPVRFPLHKAEPIHLRAPAGRKLEKPRPGAGERAGNRRRAPVSLPEEAGPYLLGGGGPDPAGHDRGDPGQARRAGVRTGRGERRRTRSPHGRALPRGIPMSGCTNLPVLLAYTMRPSRGH